MSRYLKQKNNQKGFVIFIVLIFMQVFILLNWYAINDVLLLTKFTKNAADHDVMFYLAKKLLAREELAIMMNEMPNCMISFIASDLLIENPLNWWQEKSCSGNFQMFKYYYVVELLATDSCASIDHVKQAIVDYFRITLFLHSTIDDSRIFLQSILVKPRVTVSPPTCTGHLHDVQVGRQSWRELIY